MNFRECCRAHPLILFALIGIVIRLILTPLLTRTYDVASWGELIENIRAGEGLYDVKGYYYTPLWGYFLNVMAVITSVIPGMDTLATAADVSFSGFFPHADTRIPTLDFAVFIKIPLIAFDVAVAYTLYRLVLKLTGDGEKAVTIFAAWMLLLPAILVSSVAGMFDNLAVLLLLLSLLCLMYDRPLSAGTLLGLGVMLKVYPGLALVPMACYILAITKDRSEKMMKCMKFLASAIIIAAVIVLPPVLKGQTSQVFYLFTSRLKGNGTSSTVTTEGLILLCGMLVLVIASFAIFRFLQRHFDNPEKSLIGSVTLIIGLAVGVTFSIQYVAEVLPLILLMLIVFDIGSKRLLILFSALYLALILEELPALLLTLEESTSLFSVDSLENLARSMDSGFFRDLVKPSLFLANQYMIVIMSALVLYDALFGRKNPWKIFTKSERQDV